MGVKIVGYLEDCKLRYYGKDDSALIIKKMRTELDPDMTFCEHELLCIFNDVLTDIPCCYWDKEICTQTISGLEDIIDKKADILIDESIMEHFLIAYHTYIQVSTIINDLSGLNDSHTIKNRQYRIPTYITIVEGCLTNLLHFIVLLLNQVSEKDYSLIFKLKPLCDVANKNGFNLLTANINVNIRNAINHGGIVFKEGGKEIDFHYNENHHNVSCTLQYYEFDKLIESVYDSASAIILGVSYFLNNHWANVIIDMTQKSFVTFSLFSMKLSIPAIRCRYLSEVANNKQLNADIAIVNTDRTYILQTSIELAMLIYEQYSDYKQYLISFSSERLQTSWVRFTNEEIIDMIYKKRDFADVITEAINRKDVVIFNPSTEEVNLQEIKYFRFPNYTGERFSINHIADASLPEQKRLRCNLFIGEVNKKEDIIKIIYESIEWLKGLKNVDSPTLHHKNGDIEADSLYINVYRYDARKNKELFPGNENFICFVDYNVSGYTTLKCGGLPPRIWQKFYHEKMGQIDIAWRESKYIIRKAKKVSVNDPCPCGSGKKFKKCCKGKGIFD